VPAIQSRSGPSRFARVASSFTDLVDFPLFAAVSSTKEANFARLGRLLLQTPTLSPIKPAREWKTHHEWR
jgi:hypothetical protein